MIKLQDFARQCGVTDRAIQKHLKKYESELTGLFERKGPNGTWLSDEACQILRSKMKEAPLLVDHEARQTNNNLQKRIEHLENLLGEKEVLLAQAQRQAQDLLNWQIEFQPKLMAAEDEKQKAVEEAIRLVKEEHEDKLKKMSVWDFLKEKRKK